MGKFDGVLTSHIIDMASFVSINCRVPKIRSQDDEKFANPVLALQRQVRLEFCFARWQVGAGLQSN